MQDSMIRCVRCKGRKKMFKVNSIYSEINTGGIEVQCPMCLGNGVTKSLEEALEEIKKENKKHKTRDLKHGEKPREGTDGG